MKYCLLTLALATHCAALMAAPAEASPESDDDLALEALLRREVQGPSRYAQSLLDAPAAVSVIGRKEAAALGHTTVGDMLGRLPGISVGNTRSYSAVGVRGFNRPGDYNSRVLMAVDGNRVNDAIYDQGLPQLEFPLVAEWVKRVELVQGPGSSIYGSNALLGVVNVVSVDGADAPGFAALGSAGEHGLRRVEMHYGDADLGGGDLFIGLNLQRTQGENLYLPELGTADGWVRGLDGERHAALFAKYRLGAWRASLSSGQRVKRAPTAPYDTLPGVRGTGYRDASTMAEVAWDEGWQDDTRRSLRLGLTHTEFRGDYVFGEDPQLLNRDTARASSVTLEGKWLWRGLLNHEMMLGAEYRAVPHAEQRNYYVEPFEGVLDTTSANHAVGVYAQDQWRLSSQWRLTTGLRLDHIRGYAAAWSPRAALVYRPDERQSVKLLWARSYRTPNLFERFYDDGGDSQVANPSLTPERMGSFELAWEYLLPADVALSANLYQTRMTHLIEAVPITDDGYGAAQYRNVGRARLRGLEAGLERRAAAGWLWRTSVSLIGAENDRGERLSNAPRWMFKGHLISPAWHGWQLGAAWTTMGPRDGRGGRVPTYASLDAHVQLRLSDRQSVALHVDNALDRANLDPAIAESRLSAVPQPRRALRLDWRIGF